MSFGGRGGGGRVGGGGGGGEDIFHKHFSSKGRSVSTKNAHEDRCKQAEVTYKHLIQALGSAVAQW